MDENLKKLHYITISLVYLDEDKKRGIIEVKNMRFQKRKKDRFAQAERIAFLRKRHELLDRLIKEAERDLINETKKYTKNQLKFNQNGTN